MRRLPVWLGGATVTPLAYALVCDALANEVMTPSVTAERHAVDEAEVLRAMVELTEKGVLVPEEKT